MTADESPVYEVGDVVFGADPYKGADSGRPWLIIENHDGKPFHGEQYVALSLTTRTWMDGLIEVGEEAWVRGGTPRESRIIPWAVQSISADDIDSWQGRITDEYVTEATDSLVAYLRE